MSGLTALEAELEQAWRKYHVRAQVARFVSGWVVAFIWGLKQGFTDWTTVLPIAGTAAWVVAMEMWPQLPWQLAQKVIRGHVQTAAAGGSPATAPPYAPPAGSARQQGGDGT